MMTYRGTDHTGNCNGFNWLIDLILADLRLPNWNLF